MRTKWLFVFSFCQHIIVVDGVVLFFILCENAHRILAECVSLLWQFMHYSCDDKITVFASTNLVVDENIISCVRLYVCLSLAFTKFIYLVRRMTSSHLNST